VKDWIDYNGHMNMAFYNVVFDRSVDHLLNLLDIGEAYAAATNHSLFSMEIHVTYAQEVVLGDPLRVSLQLLDHDTKRLHLFMQMHHAKKGFVAATCEQLSLHVDRGARRAAPMPQHALERVARLQQRHSQLARPDVVGRVIGITRR